MKSQPVLAHPAPVTVLLPTRNGASTLVEVLPALEAQRRSSRWRFSTAAVDSASTDGTVGLLAQYGVPVRDIEVEAFQHGRTRNLLASMAPHATYLVYLSQDATPMEGWLDALVGAVDARPQAAGAFSRQVPRPGCSPFVARRMIEDWPQVGGTERIVKRRAAHAGGAGLDHAAAHFANTSSCLRRSVWEQLPFPEVEFGEDVAWAMRALRAGFEIVYEPDSRVLHSHSGSLARLYRENLDHGRAMREILGAGAPGAVAPMPPRHGTLQRITRDLRFVWSRPTSTTERLFWTAYAPFWYAASVAGQWTGRRASAWPDWILRRLATQDRRARG